MEKGKKMVVLLVGGPILPSSLVIVLIKMGYAAEWVSTGEEALERLRRYRSDYDMMIILSEAGDKEQYDFSYTVREMPKYRKLLIICLGDDIERLTGPVHVLASKELQKKLVEFLPRPPFHSVVAR